MAIGFQGDDLDFDGSGIDGVLISLVLNPDGSDSGGTGGSLVPEPATWGMMVLGFGMTGLAVRRRRPSAIAG